MYTRGSCVETKLHTWVEKKERRKTLHTNACTRRDVSSCDTEEWFKGKAGRWSHSNARQINFRRETSVCTWLWIIRLSGTKRHTSAHTFFVEMKVFVSLRHSPCCGFTTVRKYTFSNLFWFIDPRCEINFNYNFAICVAVSIYLRIKSRTLLHWLKQLGEIFAQYRW